MHIQEPCEVTTLAMGMAVEIISLTIHVVKYHVYLKNTPQNLMKIRKGRGILHRHNTILSGKISLAASTLLVTRW